MASLRLVRRVLVSAVVVGTQGCYTGGATEPYFEPLATPHLISGATFSCLFRPSLDLRCWGQWASMQVPVPPMVVGSADVLPQFAVLRAGGHACGIATNGVAYCWGWNESGQLGDGTVAGRQSPTPVATNLRFRSIAPGTRSTCGIDIDGRAHCWGLDDLGALGGGTVGEGVPHVTPRAVDADIVFGGIDGAWVYCALGESPRGRVYCWGTRPGTFDPGVGIQPGDCGEVFALEFEGVDCLRPTPLADERQFVEVSIGGNTACGVGEAGDAFCWGEGSRGQLGNGQSGSGTYALEPVAVAGGHTFRVVTAGATHVCALTISDVAYCWGNNFRGYLGTSANLGGFNSEPQQVDGGHEFAALSAGWYHTCGMTYEGQVWCWGAGASRALGRDPGQGDSYTPLLVSLD
jgi:alpha-tubulin suppressor-like RCC1 family protein